MSGEIARAYRMNRNISLAGAASKDQSVKINRICPAADKAADEPTADLLTQRMQVHEKTAWMLRSLLEA